MITFVKMQSNGNNFLVLDNLNALWNTERLKTISVQCCDVKRGIGADGLLVVETSQTETFKMRLFNRNGSEAEMCGNGARCIARYAYDSKIAPAHMQFETLAGPIKADVMGSKVKIGMGCFDEALFLKHETFHHVGINYTYDFMTIGVPHVAIPVLTYDVIDYETMLQIGAVLDGNHVTFPEGTNVNFVKVLGPSVLEVSTYERGVESITDSCGTGSCASVLAASTWTHLQSPVRVINPGGENIVYFHKEKGIFEVELEGDTAYCADKITVGGF